MLRKSWWVDFTIESTRYRKKSPDNSRAGALAYEALIRQRLARGERLDRDPEAKKLTFEQFAWTWFNEYVVANNKHSEQRSKQYALASSLIPFFGKMFVSEIGAYEIERFKAQQVKEGFSSKTLTNRLSVLNKCLVTAYEWLKLDGAPPKIKWPRWQLPEIDYLSPDECELLLSHADGVIFEMIFTALRTGMRQGELRGLQWSSIDWLTRIVAVRHSRDDFQRALVRPKNGKTRHIPLDTDLYAILLNRKQECGYVFLASDGQPFTNDRIHDAMGRLCRAAGFRRIGWHTLRHTFASHLTMRGVPLPAVKELMGHADITTTMRYSHMSPSTLRAAIDMLNPNTLQITELGQPVGNAWQAKQQNELRAKGPAPEYA